MNRKLCALVLLLVITWPLAAVLNGCRRNCENKCHYFTGVGITAIDNADSLPHDVVNNRLYAKALLLRIHVTDSVNSNMGQCYSWSRTLITGAYASYKMDECLGTRERLKLVSFRISSNKVFDAQHPADSSLNDMFYCRATMPYIYGGDYDFYLRYPPADTGTHVFTVTYTFDSSRIFKASTPALKLL